MEANNLRKWSEGIESRRKSIKLFFAHYSAKRSIEFMQQYSSQQSWQKLQLKIAQRRMRRIAFRSFATAASVLLIIGLTYTFSLYKYSNNDIAPSATVASFPETGSRKAVLTLEDGEVVDLSIKDGNISEKIANNANKMLTYATTDTKATDEPVKFNTLTVPRGGEYQLVLSDGTKIWMNAESSLRYPVRFKGKREVILSGEAYFEVAKDAAHPFIVHIGNNAVEVLGTKFNVSAYPENNIYTTLAHGSVKVINSEGSVTLTPNQQAVMHSEGSIRIQQVDASLYTSWTTGVFEFKKTQLKDIADQLSRWYNVNFQFASNELKQKNFAGVIFRNEELNLAIEVIEDVSDVKFVRTGNIIRIESKK